MPKKKAISKSLVRDTAKNPRTGFPARQPAAEWPQLCLGAEKLFQRQHARLFRMVGAPVHTPYGPGFLQQVFHDVARVLLDSEEPMRWYKKSRLLTRDFRIQQIQPLKGVNYETLAIRKKPVAESEIEHINKRAATA